MLTISVIGLDGFHNNGKTTQLRLLKESLEDSGFFVVNRRGDGSRKGMGENESDPASVWWEENRQRILDAGFEGEASYRAGIEAATRINRELYLTKNWWMPREMRRNGFENGVLLVDRGLVSRMFVHRRHNPDVSFSEISTFKVGGLERDVVIPDITFLLHASRDLLIERNQRREDGKQKTTFNETVFSNYYTSYEEHLRTLPNEIESTIVRVDASGTIDQVHQTILGYTTESLLSRHPIMLENLRSGGKERI